MITVKCIYSQKQESWHEAHCSQWSSQFNSSFNNLQHHCSEEKKMNNNTISECGPLSFVQLTNTFYQDLLLSDPGEKYNCWKHIRAFSLKRVGGLPLNEIILIQQETNDWQDWSWQDSPQKYFLAKNKLEQNLWLDKQVG